MKLETEHLILRPWTDADRAPFVAMSANPEIARYFSGTLTAEQANARIDRFKATIAGDGFGTLAAELRETGEFAGVIGLSRIDDTTRAAIPSHPEVEIGWTLARQMWGKGLATEGARACLAYAWETLDLREVVAFTSRLNTPSMRVMEKIGMSRDPHDDFDHPNPKMPEGHPLRPHVLYRKTNPLAS